MAPRDDDRRTGEDRRSGDGEPSLPHAWLYQELTSLRELVTDQHTRLRTDMANGFSGVRQDMRAHERDDASVERRGFGIEEREKAAANTVTKRNMLGAGAISVAVGPVAAWIVKKLLG